MECRLSWRSYRLSWPKLDVILPHHTEQVDSSLLHVFNKLATNRIFTTRWTDVIVVFAHFRSYGALWKTWSNTYIHQSFFCVLSLFYHYFMIVFCHGRNWSKHVRVMQFKMGGIWSPWPWAPGDEMMSLKWFSPVFKIFIHRYFVTELLN